MWHYIIEVTMSAEESTQEETQAKETKVIKHFFNQKLRKKQKNTGESHDWLIRTLDANKRTKFHYWDEKLK